MRTRRPFAGSLVLAALLAGAAPLASAASDTAPGEVVDGAVDGDADIDIVATRPNAEHEPGEVVEIVVAALRDNAETPNDAGIATVFAFASPGNRAATGPFERFRDMVKRGYSDMLGFAESRFGDLQLGDDTAMQVVWLMQDDGREVGYVFQLGLQHGGEYDGMWMTDAVYPIGEGPRSGTSI